jgi:hypothetical protein
MEQFFYPRIYVIFLFRPLILINALLQDILPHTSVKCYVLGKPRMVHIKYFLAFVYLKLELYRRYHLPCSIYVCDLHPF